jgi:hypothetical protein
VFGELGPDACRVGLRLVHLVHGDDDRDVRSARVVDRFERLRHHAVVRRDHEDREVGDLRASGTHRGECFVTRRVDEGDALAVLRDLVRADVLGDPAVLGGGDVG